MMSALNFYNETGKPIKELESLKALLNYAVKREKLKGVTINVIFVTNSKITEINKQYRQQEIPTDVLTFPLAFKAEDILPGYNMLGEIYIAVLQAQKQAELYQHSLLRELGFLLTHGFFHLLGYDHNNEEEEEQMITKQEVILNEFGIER